MTWFRVDDRFPESDKVIDLVMRPEGLAALGLWTLCGAWAAGRGNGGKVTEAVVRRFRGTKRHVVALIEVGLWEPSDDAWQFHDWDDYNESAETAAATKAAEREGARKGNHERWHTRRGVVDPTCSHCVGGESGTRSGGYRGTRRDPESGGIPPGPGPDPDPGPDKTDHGDTPDQVSESDARDDEDDLIEESFADLRIVTRSARVRVLVAIRAVLPLEVADAEVVDVAREILTLATSHVQHPVAYIEKACRESAGEVRGIWERSPKPPRQVVAA